MPAAKGVYVQGTFKLKTEDGIAHGEIVVKDHSMWGLGPLFRAAQTEPGDVLVLKFDLARSQAVAILGDESLIDAWASTA